VALKVSDSPCTQANFIELSASAAIEKATPTDGNNCLMYALLDNKDMGKSFKTIRNEIVSIAYTNRYKKFNGKTLDSWVCETSKMDFAAWARDFATNNAMSDQIVLILWPLYKGESVWVWQSTQGGYQHSHICRFGTTQKVRHVVYREDKLHYNTLRIIELSSIPERALTASKQVARAYHNMCTSICTSITYTSRPALAPTLRVNPMSLRRPQFISVLCRICDELARHVASISSQAAGETSELVDAQPQVRNTRRTHDPSRIIS
jgi:hypothetical protein